MPREKYCFTLFRQMGDAVNRNIYAEIPPKVEYSLTELGFSLIPHITGLIDWALANFDKFKQQS